jgi:hypothetical protein
LYKNVSYITVKMLAEIYSTAILSPRQQLFRQTELSESGLKLYTVLDL